jgi:hypothetical protein
MNRKEVINQDERLRRLFSGTQLKADGNLKFRIMRQIETENALNGIPAKDEHIMPLIRNMLPVIGVMYVLIAVVAAGVFFAKGEAVTLFVSVILIASVCGLFLMISIFDDRRRSKSMHR